MNVANKGWTINQVNRRECTNGYSTGTGQQREGIRRTGRCSKDSSDEFLTSVRIAERRTREWVWVELKSERQWGKGERGGAGGWGRCKWGELQLWKHPQRPSSSSSSDRATSSAAAPWWVLSFWSNPCFVILLLGRWDFVPPTNKVISQAYNKWPQSWACGGQSWSKVAAFLRHWLVARRRECRRQQYGPEGGGAPRNCGHSFPNCVSHMAALPLLPPT